MTNREKVFHLIEELPDYKLNLVLAYLQGLTAAAEAEEDLYCERLYQEYLTDTDRNSFISLEQAAKRARSRAMTYKILIEKPAMKFIQKQPKPQQERLLQAIAALPEQGDRKPMTGHSGLFRLRVGSYRILYSVKNNILVVHVLNAGNRSDIYKSYQ